jgi:hypothetical protein
LFQALQFLFQALLFFLLQALNFGLEPAVEPAHALSFALGSAAFLRSIGAQALRGGLCKELGALSL